MRILIATCTLMVALSVNAETVTAGKKGGYYCASGEELDKLVEQLVETKNPKLNQGCYFVPNGSNIYATKAITSENFVIGRADISGTNNAHFVLFKDEVQRSSEGRTFKRVSPSDVRNTPRKWTGRDIEFANVNVYWVDDDDVRILTSINMTVFATAVRGPERDFFKQNCETQAEATSRQCSATIRFSYGEHSEDQPTGIVKRTVITTNDVELIRVGKRR